VPGKYQRDAESAVSASGGDSGGAIGVPPYVLGLIGQGAGPAPRGELRRRAPVVPVAANFKERQAYDTCVFRPDSAGQPPAPPNDVGPTPLCLRANPFKLYSHSGDFPTADEGTTCRQM